VHHPADDVGAPGVDRATRLSSRGRQPRVVPEHRHHVVDVELALDQALARVQGLGESHVSAMVDQQVGHPVQQCPSLLSRRERPGPAVERFARRRDGRLGVNMIGLVDRGHQATVGGTVDVPGGAAARGHPAAPDVQVRHCPPPR
jgi:hypothetical protein